MIATTGYQFVLFVNRICLLCVTGKGQKLVKNGINSAKSLVTLPSFCFWIFWNIWNASLFWRGDGVGIVVGLVIIMALGILVALVVLVALDFIDALVF